MCLGQYEFSGELLIQISSGLMILNGLYGHPLHSNKKQVKFNQIISTPFRYILVKIKFILIMSKGFATDNLTSKKLKKKVISNEPQGRLISWSPWPPANFQTRYPAFPFVLTILIIVIGQWYLSLLR